MLRRMRLNRKLYRSARRRAHAADRMLARTLVVLLLTVLLASLWVGVRSLREAAGSPAVAEPSPLARAQAVDLEGQSLDHAGGRIFGDPHRKSAVIADEAVQAAQQG